MSKQFNFGINSPIPYTSALDRSAFPTIKISQTFENDHTETQKIPIFSGEFGLEGLEYCGDKYLKVATRDMMWDTDEFETTSSMQAKT